MSQSFETKIGVRTYTLSEKTGVEDLMYDVFLENDYLFTIGIGESGGWEATQNVDGDLVRKLGEFLESKGV